MHQELEIIKGYQQGGRQAQSDLYRKYSLQLFGICMRYCKNKMEAEDLLHDCFVIIFRNIKQYDFKGSFEGWLKRIVIRESIRRIKKNKQLSKNLDQLDLLEFTASANYDITKGVEELLISIQQMSPGYRTIFNLYFIEGYSHKQIAELLDISVSTTTSQLTRAKRIVKKAISNKFNSKYALS